MCTVYLPPLFPLCSNWNQAGISMHIKTAVEEVGGIYRRVPQVCALCVSCVCYACAICPILTPSPHPTPRLCHHASQGFHDDRRCLFPSTVEPYVNNANTRCSDAYQFIHRDEDVYCRYVLCVLSAFCVCVCVCVCVRVCHASPPCGRRLTHLPSPPSSGVVLFMDADVFLVSPYAPTTSLRTANQHIASVPLHKKYSTVSKPTVRQGMLSANIY